MRFLLLFFYANSNYQGRLLTVE